jgi:cyclopropane-fatty-acyl-phospholipid synthase
VIEGMAAEGLEVIDAEALREHYAKTLWHWCEGLEANAEAARAKWARRSTASGASISPARRTRSTRLAVAVAAPGRQAAAGRPFAASRYTRVHVSVRGGEGA